MAIGVEVNASVLRGSLEGSRARVDNAPLSVKRNTVWTMAGNTMYAASQWLQVVVIARLSTPLDVGHYAFAMGLCTPVFMMSNLQLRSIQATDSSRQYT